MLKNRSIVIDEFFLDEDGLPSKHVDVFNTYLRVHPECWPKLKEGFDLMFPGELIFCNVYNSMVDFLTETKGE